MERCGWETKCRSDGGINTLEILKQVKMKNKFASLKAKVLNGHSGEEINETIKESIDNQSIVFTDKSTSYVDIADFVQLHVMEKSSKTTEENFKNRFILLLTPKKKFAWKLP